MSSTPDNQFQNRPDFVAAHEFMALLGPGAMSDLSPNAPRITDITERPLTVSINESTRPGGLSLRGGRSKQ
jgi:hypothetical protein